MFKKPSLCTRIAVGKLVGFTIGLIGFFMMPTMIPDASLMLRVGGVFWYATLGAIIGVFGVFTYHPILKLPMPWWFRDPLIGAWMNAVVTLFAYDTFQNVIIIVFGVNGIITSPFWFSAEGAIVGLIIGFFATKYGGEGKEVVNEQL